MKCMLSVFLLLCGCASFNQNKVVDEFALFENVESARTVSQYSEELDQEVNTQAVAFQDDESLDYDLEAVYSIKKYYTLQVGAYPTKQIAAMRASKLNVSISPVTYEKVKVNGKTWQRVYVGKFTSKKSAENVQKKLSGDSFVKAVQVRE